jgi:hypothetical protein
MSRYDADRAAASAWAKDLLTRAKADPRSIIILDTETTGLQDAEIVQLGLLYPDGTTALDTLVRPSFDGLGCDGIPADATCIHGITDAMVADAPSLFELLPQLEELMHGKTVIVYNVAYDFDILLGCLYRRWRAPDKAAAIWQDKRDDSARDKAYAWLNGAPAWECAMQQYAQWYGEWNSYRGRYKWQRLPGGDHSAIGDCRACLSVLRKMAGEGVLL